MNIKKYAPWSWFEDEKKRGENTPVRTALDRPASSFPIFRLHSEIDRLFDEAFRGFPSMFSSDWGLPEMTSMVLKPSIDIKDTDENYIVNVEIPGVAKEDVDIQVQDNTLTVRGEKKQEKKEDKENYHCIERHYGSFERTLTLPQDANADNIDAKFKDGVLTLTIKRKAISKPKESKKIEVKAA